MGREGDGVGRVDVERCGHQEQTQHGEAGDGVAEQELVERVWRGLWALQLNSMKIY